MFKFLFMACTLHIYDVFDERHVIVRMSLVRSLFKFHIRDLVFLLVIIFEIFIKF